MDAGVKHLNVHIYLADKILWTTLTDFRVFENNIFSHFKLSECYL